MQERVTIFPKADDRAGFRVMPGKSVSEGIAVKRGYYNNCREAKRRSFISQRSDWVHARGATSGQVTGQYCHASQQQGASDERRWIGRTHPVKETLDYAAGGEGPGQANRGADGDQFQPLADHEPQHVDALRAERHPDADFTSALTHEIG